MDCDPRAILREAMRSLVHLDAARLEELAIACRALTRDERQDTVARDGTDRETQFELAALGRMVDLTEANLRVLYRSRAGRSAYGPGRGRAL